MRELLGQKLTCLVANSFEKPTELTVPYGPMGLNIKNESDKQQKNVTNGSVIITLNAGSSSIKFAIFEEGDPPQRLFKGGIEQIGNDAASDAKIIAAIKGQLGDKAVTGIGHRIVHGGMKLLDHQLVTPEVVHDLEAAQELDLTHLPREIALVKLLEEEFKGIPQAICLDTAFHRHMPRVAQLLPIPRRYLSAGVRRFGFHGLSYSYLVRRLAELTHESTARGRVIFAHLGSGASMAAVRDGKPMDTTMAFTATAGLVMGTRPGDIDPGLLTYLGRTEQMSMPALDEFISHQCGLLGVSGISSDTRQLLALRSDNVAAAEAIDLFCHQARKFVGAMAASMGGLDTMVFSGGIGEHQPEIRAQICAGLEFLGIEFDASANQIGSGIISTPASRVILRVIPTDEEQCIAQIVHDLLAPQAS